MQQLFPHQIINAHNIKTTMARFKIEVTLKEKYEKRDDKIFENEVRGYLTKTLGHGGYETDTYLDYGFRMELNDILLVEKTRKDDIGEFAGVFYSYILKEIILDILNGKEYKYSFVDGPFRLIFKPIDQKEVLLTFDWDIGSTYFPTLEDKRDQLRDVPVPFDECIDELYNTGSKFINQLLEINPKIAESSILKELIEARNKAKKAMDRYKHIKWLK